MKLEINTEQKTIKVLDYSVTMRELVHELAKLFPEEAFMEYILICHFDRPENPPFNPWNAPHYNPNTVWPIINPTVTSQTGVP